MILNGLFILFALAVSLSVHLTTRAYYIRMINELRTVNRVLRSQLHEAERMLKR